MGKKKFGKGHLIDRYNLKVNGGFRADRYGGQPLAEKEEGFRNLKNFDNVVSTAAMNDYDTRRGLEALSLAGNEDATELLGNGLQNAEDVMAAQNLFKDEAGYEDGDLGFLKKGGRARNTQNFVKKDREQLATKDFLNSKLEELKNKSEENADTSPEEAEVKNSEELQAALDREEAFNSSPSTLFKKTSFNFSPATENNKTANPEVPESPAAVDANSYLNQYKADVIKGGNIKENKQLNLQNAFNTVSGM